MSKRKRQNYLWAFVDKKTGKVCVDGKRLAVYETRQRARKARWRGRVPQEKSVVLRQLEL